MAIRVALIGSGIHSREKLLPAIKQCSDLDITAIYSRTLDSATKLAAGIPGILLASDEGNADNKNNLQSLITSTEIDAVIVALPIDIQLKTVSAFLESGKHVLSEKPIAAAMNEKGLDHLLQNHQSNWSIAENYRFLSSFLFAAEQVKLLGNVLSFRTRMHKMVLQGEKFYETSWRKTPRYQGGFLLDGGVHFIAGMRVLLGPENEPIKVSAFSSQLQKHLPPVDTIDAVWQLKSGISGTFSCSFGTTFEGDEYAVSCEKGTVVVSKGCVTVKPLPGSGVDAVEGRDLWNGPGVQEEIDAWAAGISSGEVDRRLSPQEALLDLKILEAMLRSGENGGVVKEVV
ncbi:hypothetical protein Vi05172_g2898 [Venturia inaequalis]|nr:hypothetical protein Vi05172_g2898 [Venturia inaequalis]